MKSAIEADTEILRQFGAGQRTDIRHGVASRVERLVAAVAKKIAQNRAVLDEYLPMLEFISRHHPPTWLHIAALYEELATPEALDHAKDAIRHHLEVAPPAAAMSSWQQLADLCRRTNDIVGEVHAFVELSELQNVTFDEISNAANRLNFLLSEKRAALDSDERQILVRRLANAMERRVKEADATACSRLAWLCVHLKDMDRANQHAKRGLALDPANEHCLRLATRLSDQQRIARE